MKRIVALVTVALFALSVASNYSVAQTNKPAETPKTECKCGKDCTGKDCTCGCHTAKKAEDAAKTEKKEGA